MPKLKKKVKKEKLAYNPKLDFRLNNFIPEAELDFHNLGRLQPFDIEINLDHFIEDCQIAGHKNVLVITGKGLVVKPIVQRLLKHHKQVESFKLAGYFNGQGGAFEVVLK